MEFLDYFLWGFAVFAVLYGVFVLLAPRSILLPAMKKQLAKKGISSPTEEDLSKQQKVFRMLGGVCIVSGAVLFFIQFTGGILG